jgi:hypothetical protein
VVKHSYKTVYDGVISDAIADVDKKGREHLEEFVDLSDDIISEIFSIVWLSMKNVILDLIAEKKDIILPNIGRLHIKGKRKIAYKHLNNVARKYGYESIDDVPKDLFEEIKSKANKLLNDELRNQPKAKRTIHEVYKPEAAIKGNSYIVPKIFKLKKD